MTEAIIAIGLCCLILLFLGAFAYSVVESISSLLDWLHERRWRYRYQSPGKKKREWYPPYFATYSPVYSFLFKLFRKAKERWLSYYDPRKELISLDRNIAWVIKSFKVGDEYDLMSNLQPVFSPRSMITQVDCGRCRNQELGIWLKIEDDEEGNPKSNLYFRGVCLKCARKMNKEDRDRFSVVFTSARPPEFRVKDTPHQDGDLDRALGLAQIHRIPEIELDDEEDDDDEHDEDCECDECQGN